MIVLFTDFGVSGPYLGQMKAVLLAEAPGVPVIDLFADAPTQDPMAAAYLLAAYADEFAPDAIFLGVVDPGVGSDRRPVMVRAGTHWFVGPDNGLFAIAARRHGGGRWHRIDWRPQRLSASFHGRDLFAPAAGKLAHGVPPAATEFDPKDAVGADWPDDLARIVYIDHFGNAMTGLRASTVDPDAWLEVAGRRLDRARTYSDLAEGAPFWYQNANGLVEIAVNRGRADQVLGLTVGPAVTVSP